MSSNSRLRLRFLFPIAATIVSTILLASAWHQGRVYQDLHPVTDAWIPQTSSPLMEPSFFAGRLRPGVNWFIALNLPSVLFAAVPVIALNGLMADLHIDTYLGASVILMMCSLLQWHLIGRQWDCLVLGQALPPTKARPVTLLAGYLALSALCVLAALFAHHGRFFQIAAAFWSLYGLMMSAVRLQQAKRVVT